MKANGNKNCIVIYSSISSQAGHFLFVFVCLNVKKKYCFAIECWGLALFPSTSFFFDFFMTLFWFHAIKSEFASKNPPRMDSNVICFMAKWPAYGLISQPRILQKTNSGLKASRQHYWTPLPLQSHLFMLWLHHTYICINWTDSLDTVNALEAGDRVCLLISKLKVTQVWRTARQASRGSSGWLHVSASQILTEFFSLELLIRF